MAKDKKSSKPKEKGKEVNEVNEVNDKQLDAPTGNGSGSSKRMPKAEYETVLEPLQLELNRLARWVAAQNKRLLVLFEGRDTAGKGGVISAISECLNPRQCQVVALSKPDEVERGQWYFLFDRSWYNRAGVEKVMGYCTADDVNRFLRQAPAFEKLLVDDGILLFKYWLTVDQAEQEARFADRRDEPLKRWKLSPVDLQSRSKYRDYGTARDAMLDATHTRHAPWTLVDFNDQRRGRLTLIRHLLDQLPDCKVPEQPIDFPPLVGKPLKEAFGGPIKPVARWP
jgi:polyphosphate kinase 2